MLLFKFRVNGVVVKTHEWIDALEWQNQIFLFVLMLQKQKTQWKHVHETKAKVSGQQKQKLHNHINNHLNFVVGGQWRESVIDACSHEVLQNRLIEQTDVIKNFWTNCKGPHNWKAALKKWKFKYKILSIWYG